MGVTVRKSTVVADTGLTGSMIQRVTITNLGGLTPGLVRVVTSGATSDGTADAEARGSEGWSDGTNEFVVGWRGRDVNGVQFATDTDDYGSTDKLGVVIDQSTQALDDEFAFSSFGTNYVEVQWNGGASAPAAAYRLTVTLYAGTDLNPEVGTFALATGGSTGDTQTVTLTDSGLHPALLRFVTTRAGVTTGNNFHAQVEIGTGWGQSDQGGTPVLEQFAFGWAWEDADTRPYQGSVSYSSQESGGVARCLATATVPIASGSGSNELELTDTNAGDFQVTRRNAIESTARDVGYVAIDFGGVVSTYVGYYEQVGSTDGGYDATPNITDPGFQPQFLDWNATNIANTGYGRGNLHGSIEPFCVVDEDDTAGDCHGWLNENRVQNATDTFSFYSSQLIEVREHNDASLIWSATFGAFTSTGLDLAIGTIPASVTKLNHYVAIETGSVAQTLTPSVLTVDAELQTPSVALGGLTKVPAVLTTELQLQTSALLIGTRTANPQAVTAELQLQTPTIALGGVTITPAVITAEFQVQAPSVSQTTLIEPAVVTAELQVQAPTTALGVLAIEPTVVTAELEVQTPAITLGGVTLATVVVTAQLTLQAPAIAQGGLTIQPTELVVEAQVQAPSIALGGITLTPAVLTAELQVQAPASVGIGGQTVTPATVTADFQAQTPTIAFGGVSVAPAVVTAELVFQAPAVTRGATTLTPPVLTAELQVQTAQTAVGTLTVAPAAVTAELQLQAPSILGGDVTLQPPAFQVELEPQAPSLVLGGISAAPPVLTATLALQAPTTTLGALTVQPAAVTTELQIQAPTVVGAGTVVTPATLDVELQVQAFTVAFGGLTLAQPQPVTAELIVQAPTVDVGAGGTTVTPAVFTVTFEPQAPTIALGGITAQPATVTAQIVLGTPTVQNVFQVAPPTLTAQLVVVPSAGILYGALTVTPAVVTAELLILAPTVAVQALLSRIFSGELYIEIVRDRDRYIEVVRDRNLVIL